MLLYIRKMLLDLKDEEYRKFTLKLIPNIEENITCVYSKTPTSRELANLYAKVIPYCPIEPNIPIDNNNINVFKSKLVVFIINSGMNITQLTKEK